MYIYIYIIIFMIYNIYIISECSIKRGFAFKEQRNNATSTMPEDCTSMNSDLHKHQVVVIHHTKKNSILLNLALLVFIRLSERMF